MSFQIQDQDFWLPDDQTLCAQPFVYTYPNFFLAEEHNTSGVQIYAKTKEALAEFRHQRQEGKVLVDSWHSGHDSVGRSSSNNDYSSIWNGGVCKVLPYCVDGSNIRQTCQLICGLFTAIPLFTRFIHPTFAVGLGISEPSTIVSRDSFEVCTTGKPPLSLKLRRPENPQQKNGLRNMWRWLRAVWELMSQVKATWISMEKNLVRCQKMFESVQD